MKLFEKVHCWLRGHRWRCDLKLFATNLPCPARCDRCGAETLFDGTWRRT